MNDIWLSLGFTAIFFVAMAFRGIFGYLKNEKIAYDELKFSWKTFLKGMIRPTLLTLSTGAFAALLVGFIKLVGASGIEVSGLDQISPQVLEIGLAIADIGAIGYAIKEALYCFTLTDEQINKIRTTVYESIANDEEVGIDVSVDENGNIIASPETITPASDKALQEADGILEESEDVENDDEIGKGGIANTYPEPYRSAPKDSLIDPSTCYNRECVSYCAWKIKEITGNWLKRTGGMSAKYWINRLPENGYYEVSSPKETGKYVGVSTAGQYGHVVWFESGTTISEYNYSIVGGFGVRNINLGAYRWFQIKSPITPPTPTPTTDINVGDRVLPISWVDYNGKALKKTRDYYFVSQISGDRAVLSADSVDGAIYAAVKTSNLKKVNSIPNPTPTPTPEPIKAGDSVWASGKGYTTAKLTGRRTKDFPRTKMKVIMVVNDSLALNQHNKGAIGDASQVTGWWAMNSVEKA